MRRAVCFEGPCPISLSVIRAVGWLQRVTWRKRYRVWVKSVALLCTPKWNQKKVLLLYSVKKCFFLRKLTKKSNLFLCFSETPKIFYLCPRKTGDFFMWGLKNLSVSRSILFTVFALEMRKRKGYRKQTGFDVSVLLKTVSVLEHDQFMQDSLYIASWLFANT